MMIELDVLVRYLQSLPVNTDSNDWEYRREILYQECKPEFWALACQTAINDKTNPILKIWLMIESVNGWRRQPGLWNIKQVSVTLSDIFYQIKALSADHPLYARLAGLWAYHGAFVYHALGEYAVAADCHQTEESLALTERERFIARFNRLIEEAYAVVVKGNKKPDLAELLETADHLLTFLGRESDEDNRWRANIYCHCLVLGWLFDQLPPESTVNDWMTFFDDLSESIRPAFGPALLVMYAIDAFRSENYPRALLLASDEQVKSQIDWYSFALLVRLAVLRQTNQTEQIADVIQEIGSIGTNNFGGHLAQALVA